MRIGIIDYGAGNLCSVRNAFHNLGTDPEIVSDPDALSGYPRLVLPGVGAAGEALGRMRTLGLDEAVDFAVRERGIPMLGICLGMQVLAERLLENGDDRGFGWLSGTIAPIPRADPEISVPHTGWNTVDWTDMGIRSRGEYYFAHSYALFETDPDAVAGWTDYGATFVSAVRKGSVFAVQFHPEKSQRAGIALLEEFLAWNP